MNAKIVVVNNMLAVQLDAKAYAALKADIESCQIGAGIPQGVRSWEDNQSWLCYNGTLYTRRK